MAYSYGIVELLLRLNLIAHKFFKWSSFVLTGYANCSSVSVFKLVFLSKLRLVLLAQVSGIP